MKYEVICPYCNKPAVYCNNSEVYGRQCGKSYMCYFCRDCNAYVGTHNNTYAPLGTMANRELRQMRINTHRAIDGYWKSGLCTRDKIYKLLHQIFEKPVHVGSSDMDMCRQIIKATQEKLPYLIGRMK